MDIRVFNAALVVGWLLVTAGGIRLNLGAGLLVSGLLLIALSLIALRIAGALVFPAKAEAA